MYDNHEVTECHRTSEHLFPLGLLMQAVPVHVHSGLGGLAVPGAAPL